MENSNKKYPKTDFISKVEEPALEYFKIEKLVPSSSNEEWDALPEVLKKLLEKGLKESDQDLGISHEEMMKKVKAKYPLIDGI
ncbi:hypothetical protein [Flavobacterium sp.]|jgi:hypothetical protein|uniref:hypothetical protein n=1 Tax=Flavobacterium sp. TaxID=239 RepID=UPI0037BE52DA